MNELIFFLVSSTGRGLGEIRREWDFPRLEKWIDYCEKHPPLQAMVAAYFGIGTKEEPLRLTEENFTGFMQRLSAEAKMNG